MQNKLQELTDKLYNEGLAKGKEEGARILEDAKAEAARTVAAAKAEAEKIIADAQARAEALSSKAASDIKMASAQALQATKKDIENAALGALANAEISKALSSADIVKEILLAVAKNFNAQESVELAAVLPASLQAEMEPWIAGTLAKELGAGLKASFSKKIAGGFTIGPADGSYFVSLTEETFNEIIREYLRPFTRKLLFGE
ncbi:MAG: hypothetical protein KBS55_04435 [Bacteroidales bacterium]|nr:hypothetical protein [Candidatus Cryptobacteroides aphodequi]